jgi:pyridoxamine 5'-phosphate oxidase
MALATSDDDGVPSVRFVLLAACDERGLVFCCSRESRKAKELAASPHASVAFYWYRAGRQARAEGRVETVSASNADRHWRTYSREAQLSTWAALDQPTPRTRLDLVRAFGRAARRFAGRAVPRPAAWCAYRLVPRALEFWEQRQRHLHHRERFERSRRGWTRRLLAP